MTYPFNVRIYGLLLHEGSVLVSDEIIKGRRITKFPGGGLEYGEGPVECLVREIREELAMDALGVRHFYTTEFFQPSLFHTGQVQVLSIYFQFRVSDPGSIEVTTKPFAFKIEAEGAEAFRWLSLPDAVADDVTLPIDRVVLEKLLSEH